jgi:hypothetical protein
MGILFLVLRVEISALGVRLHIELQDLSLVGVIQAETHHYWL